MTFDASRKPKRRESSFATIVCCVKLAGCIYVASLFILERPFEYMHETGGVRSAARGGETSRSPMAWGASEVRHGTADVLPPNYIYCQL